MSENSNNVNPDSKEEKSKTPEEELADLKSTRKFEIGFFIVIASLLTIYIILQITGVLAPFALLRSWYSCDSSSSYFGSMGGAQSFGDVVWMVIFYIFGPLIIVWITVLAIGYAPYDAFIKKPKEIRALEKKIQETNADNQQLEENDDSSNPPVKKDSL